MHYPPGLVVKDAGRGTNPDKWQVRFVAGVTTREPWVWLPVRSRRANEENELAHMPTEERSVQIIEATVRVIAEHGVANATTRRITDAAGAPLASLHYCFRDKDGLYLAVFEHLALEATRIFDAIEPAELDITAAHLVRQSVQWVTDHSDYALAQFDLYLWMLRHRPDLAAKSYAVSLRATTEVLRRAAKPSVSAAAIENLASVILSVFDGLVLQWTSHQDRARVVASADSFCAGIPAMCHHTQR
ncbi:TetR/AcrR family transcriptional regulator [Nocardia amikacinitolerans]|uniref:TetR/AcrR family transcriptional regulator n=1 Tax=Nocardia amikacinitolerans TaxID=756689 RepID=UPI0020A4D0C1|nr:TetR/AcrR family transcriptional regulator [Nocardia amikacinitolerans]